MDIIKIRHSLSHILAAAVQKLYPDVRFGIGPPIENGFYYDFDLKEKVSPEDLPQVEGLMKSFIEKEIDFQEEKMSYKEAQKIFKNQPFKLELIEEYYGKDKEKAQVKTYRSEEFVDLCKGGHVKNTREINPEAFKLVSAAGAYWKGNEKNKMLTRIYGVAFEKKEQLDEYLKLQEEARKRDHKKLGKDLDLFIFSELVGAGLPLWTPKGTLLRNLLDEFVWRMRKEKGFQKVEIPHITKKDLYLKSGHWEKFGDELMKIKTREGHEFAMKPMNCPHHAQIYARKPHSWRELPQRYANTTMVYRDEQSGELSGISRTRAITQDDAHIFCRKNQINEEILAVWDIISRFYGAAGFALTVRLSLSDPAHPEKYLGDKGAWKEAENILRKIIEDKETKAIEVEGEAAFYGPKIDFIARDSIQREWQVATIQLDFNMPERFDLTCINEEGVHERIIMIHCAIMGSLERYLSILIEHLGGNFPLWLAPEQIWILPISEKFTDYALTVKKELLEKSGADLRIEVKSDNETLGKKIREGELQKIPYLAIVGEKEQQKNSVSFRLRKTGKTEELSLRDFTLKIIKETEEKI